MDSIIEKIDLDLTYNPDSTIYALDESQVDLYNQIRNMVKLDHGHLDIVLDEEDFKKILSKFADKNEHIKNIFLLDVLINTILIKAGYKVEDDESFWFDRMVYMLKEKTKEKENSLPRVHFFLDDVHDIILQTKINDLFASRGLITIGYRTKPLLSYCSSNGMPVEPIHDYRSVNSDKRDEVIKKEHQRRMKQFDIY